MPRNAAAKRSAKPTEPMTGLSGTGSSAGAGARSGINDSGGLWQLRPLARALHIILLAAAGGAVAGVGCLVTDPVPYEPAENIPPIIVPPVTSTDEPNILLVREVKYYPAVPGDAVQEDHVDFDLKVLEYNLDDVLQVRVVVNESATSGGMTQEITVPPTGERERAIKFSLEAGTGALSMSTKPCSKVIVAVSDRGWRPGPPFYEPPLDENDEPLTTVAVLQYWVWVKTSDTPDGPSVTACGGR